MTPNDADIRIEDKTKIVGTTGVSARSFIPSNINFHSWTELEPLFKDLTEREINSPLELEEWLQDFSDLQANISETRARAEDRVNCDTNNESVSQRFESFLENIRGNAEPIWNELKKRFVDNQFTADLDTNRYGPLIRDFKGEIARFREENVPLLVEMKKLESRYGKIFGSIKVSVEGAELTAQNAEALLTEPDQEQREKVWRGLLEARCSKREEADALYSEILEIREKIATNAGFENYRAYMWEEWKRYDYTQDQARDFQEAIRTHVVPVLKTIQAKQADAMGQEKLRPWDIDADPSGREGLKSPKTQDELVAAAGIVLEKVAPELLELLHAMNERGDLDLESREGKAPGAYLQPLDASCTAFIFGNSNGTFRALQTLFHEIGHSFHFLRLSSEPLYWYRDMVPEIAEVASMAMEHMALEHLESIYSKEEAERAKQETVRTGLSTLVRIAHMDAFEEWVYSNPGHNAEDREKAWREIGESLGTGEVDYSGVEEAKGCGWQWRPHLYTHPCYYLSYGIALLGALQIYDKYLKDPTKAYRAYREGLALGSDSSLPMLYNAVGANFDFTSDTLMPALETVKAI